MTTIARMVFLLCVGIALAIPATSGAAETHATPQAKERRTPDGPRRKRPAGTRRAERLVVPIWVGNAPAASLEKDDFVAKLGESEARVLGVRPSSDPMLLFVAIDFSDDLILTEAAKDALMNALRQAKSNILVSLLRIPEQPMVILDPTEDRDAVGEALRALPLSGRAGFFEMVNVVAQVTDPVLGANKIRAAVLYLTDSEIRNYRQDYTNPVINSADSRDLSRRFPDALIREKIHTLSNELLRTSVPIFVVHLNYRSDPLNEAYQTGLKRLSEATGGRSVFCRSIAEIPIAVDDIVNAIQAMGMLEVAVPPAVSGAVTLNLESKTGPVQYRTLYEITR